MLRCAISYHLYNLINVKNTGYKPATLLKVIPLHGCFSRFLNCTNDAKSRNASHGFMDRLVSCKFSLSSTNNWKLCYCLNKSTGIKKQNIFHFEMIPNSHRSEAWGKVFFASINFRVIFFTFVQVNSWLKIILIL